MKKLSALFLILLATQYCLASPESDLREYREYYKKRLPRIPMQDYANGIYSLDASRRAAWKDWEDFAPPYTDGIEMGKILFEKPFRTGRTYASCFKNGGIGIKHRFPYFDASSGEIITLEYALNKCRIRNGHDPLPWAKGKLAAISAYMAYTSRGKIVNVVVPNDPKALAHYERGKTHFFAKRGQLNFSCADCHFYNVGNLIRSELLSPAIGQTTHFPAWRKKWSFMASNKNNNSDARGFGTIQRRYKGCTKMIRGRIFKFQSKEYRALEYFHTYMSNGLPINGPGLRP